MVNFSLITSPLHLDALSQVHQISGVRILTVLLGFKKCDGGINYLNSVTVVIST